MVKHYLEESRHPLYGAVVGLIMVLLYEILIAMGSGFMGATVRNGPEVWLRTLVQFMGVSYHSVSFLWITMALVAIPYFYHKKGNFQAKMLLGITIESIIWALLTGRVIMLVLGKILLAAGSQQGGIIDNLALAIGAGLFEELVFRVFLTSALLYLFFRLFKSAVLSILLTVLIASLLFSAMHYIGNLGDPWELFSFSFRFLGGIWFTIIYVWRGFAVAAMSHAIYDIIVMVLP